MVSARIRQRSTVGESSRSNKQQQHIMGTLKISPAPDASQNENKFATHRDSRKPALPELNERPPATSSGEPLEIVQNDNMGGNTPWNKMDVRSSIETTTNFFTSKLGLSILGATVVLFLIVSFVVFDPMKSYVMAHGSGSSSTGNGDELVAPIFGKAYLTADEFRDIRVAQPGESVLLTGGLGFIGSHVTDLLLHRGSAARFHLSRGRPC